MRFGGADVTAAPLNLCAETLDGDPEPFLVAAVARHARREVVALADRIAYCAHDLETLSRSDRDQR